MNKIHYAEAVQKLLRYNGLLEERKNKIKRMKAELSSSKASLSTAEGLVKKRNKELKATESTTRRQAIEMDALQAKVTALEAVNAELEKVNVDLLYQFLKVFLL